MDHGWISTSLKHNFSNRLDGQGLRLGLKEFFFSFPFFSLLMFLPLHELKEDFIFIFYFYFYEGH